MDSLYRGLEDNTVSYPDGKLYGKDILESSPKESLAKELRFFSQDLQSTHLLEVSYQYN